jgi:hypothetical protein
VDERGDPIMDASVQLLQPHYEAGRRVLTGVLPARLTDDHRQHRIYGAGAGQLWCEYSIGQVATETYPAMHDRFCRGLMMPAPRRCDGRRRRRYLWR